MSFLFPTLLTDRPAADRRADLDPPDQSAAAAADSLGGDAVSAGKPAAQPALDPAQAAAAAGDADGGHRRARADARPPRAAQRMAAACLGRGTTHHLVLLDDSYSMSDRWDDTTALGEGEAGRPGDRRPGRTSNRTRSSITLLRFSEAARLSAGAQPKVFAEPINDTFRSQLESLLAGWERVANRRRPGRRAEGDPAAAAGGRTSRR